MGFAREIPAQPENVPPDHHRQLADRLETRHDVTIEPEYLDAAALALDAMYDRYGNPATESYHTFHNDIHGFNVGAGSWIVLDFQRHELNFDFPDREYAVGVLVGALHDIFHEKTVGGFVPGGVYDVDFHRFSVSVMSDGKRTNEDISIDVAAKFLKQLGLDDVIEDVSLGIHLTEVTFEDGKAVQKHAGKGGNHYGAIAAAIADTDGIFAGEERLTKDGARLITEMLGEDAGDEGIVTAHIKKFVENEPKFVKQKLSEFLLHMGGIAQSPEEMEKIIGRLDEHFEPYKRKALGAAALFDTKLNDAQQLQEAIKAQIDTIMRLIGKNRKKDGHESTESQSD